MTWEPDYCTVSDVKGYLRITDTVDDVLLALWVTAASRAVDNNAGRQFGQVASAEDRFYPGMWDRHEQAMFLEIDDVQDVTGLTVTDPAGNLVDSVTYQLLPRSAPMKGRPYERIRIRPASPWGTTFPWWGFGYPYGPLLGVPGTSHDFTVHALYGWTSVPAAVKAATMLQAARLAARRDSPYGVAGSPADGSEVRLFATLDPDLVTSLQAFKRVWWAR